MQLATFLRKTFARPTVDTEAIQRIKAWAGNVLAGGRDPVLSVNEIACNDPSCPGVETVILIMEPGRKTRACKIPRTLGEVTEQDVRAAIGSEA